MKNSHLHLVVNHLPIIFPIVGIIILFLGIFTKSEVKKRNGYTIFILGALASIAAMATGENTEDAIEKLQGVSKDLIHIHEEAAELFAGFSYVTGGFSLLALFSSWKNYSISRFAPYIVGLLAIITLFFAQKAGTTGGEIRHTEIRSGFSANQQESIGTDDKKTSDRDHD
ncbi:hypothetical protein [Chryseobacterium sp. MDT2-18]|uniref:hypothetical protein n=1 Tax=Chryseobacterium sp. MDT2-18 TaxID=1259136 RepID=UPI00278A24AE|nr:hypothetical protein [Chryseobacterium sp. MDT2-18]MDQ0477721.1 putative membrane protein [Chryseobacterium sp. MDT2-18]